MYVQEDDEATSTVCAECTKITSAINKILFSDNVEKAIEGVLDKLLHCTLNQAVVCCCRGKYTKKISHPSVHIHQWPCEAHLAAL